MQIDIQNEIQNLKQAVLPLIEDYEVDGAVEHLMMAFEFDDLEWSVTPVYEGAGDGHASYINYYNEKRGTLVLQGFGSDLLTAIQDLWNEIRKCKEEQGLM